MKVVLFIVAGIVIGAIVGGVLGFGFAWLVAEQSIAENPDDPSAGSVGIIGIFTGPFGLMIGAGVGGVVSGILGVRSQSAS